MTKKDPKKFPTDTSNPVTEAEKEKAKKDLKRLAAELRRVQFLSAISPNTT